MTENIIIMDISKVEKVCDKCREELIKLCGIATKDPNTPKFSMGAHLETIKEYEGPECPYECGVVTDIIEDRGNILYEIDYDVLIYEKWLRVVEK